MLRRFVHALCPLAVLLAATFTFAQAEFSAEIVNQGKESSEPTKVYFAKDKMRIEGLEHGGRGGNGAFIMNLASHTSVVLMPQQHMYMDIPQEQQNMRQMTDFFRTGDVENACSDWLKLAHNQGGTCRKVGSETVNGRSTIKYEGTRANGDVGYVWLDPKLRFPVKWEGAHEQGGELRNIQEGSQPSSLFEIPAGYTKMDMGAMMQQRMNQQH
ncbi:MAG: DUF4412 domain-containing protein [Acidobacteriia bacterium]|nr:DUF4412 domain-containing protein [Terriglobia bacterium]